MSDEGVPARPWPELHDAQRVVLLDVLRHGSRSRAELSRRTGLSRTSLSRLTRDLVELGLVLEGETVAAGGRGRPSEMLDLNPAGAHFAGVKLTGDALYAVVTDLAANVVATTERPLPDTDITAVVAAAADAIHELRAPHPHLAAIGVCLAGDVVGAGGHRRIVGSHFLGWGDEEVPLADLLSARTAVPVEIGNDVQALTAAHHWFGAGKGSPTLGLIAFGAGIGAGIVVGDVPIDGGRGRAGKIGHLRVTDDGPRCDRGHVGCVSAYATIPAIEANAGRPCADVLREATADGTDAASVALRHAARALGVVAATLVNVADVELVVITGEALEVATHGAALLEQTMREHLDPSALAPVLDLHPFQFADYAWAAAVSATRLAI